MDALECGIAVALLLLCLPALSAAGITIVVIVMSNFMLVHIAYFVVIVMIVDVAVACILVFCEFLLFELACSRGTTRVLSLCEMYSVLFWKSNLIKYAYLLNFLSYQTVQKIAKLR